MAAVEELEVVERQVPEPGQLVRVRDRSWVVSDFSIVYANARTGRASLDADDPDLRLSDATGEDGLKPLLELLLLASERWTRCA